MQLKSPPPLHQFNPLIQFYKTNIIEVFQESHTIHFDKKTKRLKVQTLNKPEIKKHKNKTNQSYLMNQNLGKKVLNID